MTIKMPYGLDLKTDLLVPIGRAANGLACGLVCPNCEKPLIAKNMGIHKEHHFAHSHLADYCGEGWLHATAKRLLAERQQLAISMGRRVSIIWDCTCPCRTHKGNLVNGVASIGIEKAVHGAKIRPDLTAFDSMGSPVSFQEVVVSHPPEVAVIEHCQGVGIPLVVFKIHGNSDLERLASLTLRPHKIYSRKTTCRCPRDNKCEQCGRLACDHHHCRECQKAISHPCSKWCGGLCDMCWDRKRGHAEKIWLSGDRKAWNEYLRSISPVPGRVPAAP